MRLSKKILRLNNSPVMITALRRNITHRSKLKNIFHETRLKEDWGNYNNTEHLLRKSSSQYQERLLLKT